jgi:hypothetical protein
VFDDDDDSSIGFWNIASNGGVRNTVVPAGGVAVLYAGESLDFMPERFSAAWGPGITLIGVDGFPTLTAGDAIGLWSSYSNYLADAIPDPMGGPHRTFVNAAAAIDFTTGFPAAADGRSIAWNGNDSATSGANWVASQPGVLHAVTSVETTIPDAQINSTDDWGNPGVLPVGSAAAGLLITEIMYAPASPLATVDFNESHFEWVEVLNNTPNAINFVTRPHVFDDIDGSKLTAANLRSGSLAAGEVGILYNKEKIAVADMEAMWGEGINFIPVENWSSLDNGTGGDTIAIWPSYSAYNTEAVTGAGRTHANALAAVEYDTRQNAGWPAVNNQSSIWLNNLSSDPSAGSSWTRAGAGSDTLSFHPGPLFDLAIDHEGGDVGSPGFAPALAPELAGDFNGDGSVDAADYVVWRKNAGPAMQYDAWRANFGMISGHGASARGSPVPEPTIAMSACIFMLTGKLFNRRRWPRALRSRLRSVRR